MKILNRAKHLYSDVYFTSESIKFEFNQMYLYFKQEHRWVECEQDTRSINISDMVDSEGTKIFASLSKDGKGGDICINVSDDRYIDIKHTVFMKYMQMRHGVGTLVSVVEDLKVTGIQS